jgi:hypothetical protein
MDIDALAREALTHFLALDFSWPGYPPYLAAWFQSVEREFGDEVWEQAATMPATETLERTGERHAGGLDAYFYRAEPGASAFGIVLRGEELVYVSLLGGAYAIPAEGRLDELGLPYPAHQLIGFALFHALGAIGAEGPTWTHLHKGAMSVSVAVDGDVFTRMGDGERMLVVERCAEIGRDAVRLFAGQECSATLRIVAKAPPAV